jgi:hypothetical protein
MTETVDWSELGVLLKELSEDLPEQALTLLEKEELRDEMLKYLNNISSIESKEYLSSVPPTPAAGDFSLEERTLVQDIAELEAHQRSIDTKLKYLIVQSHGSIVQTKTQLTEAEELFNHQFNTIFKSIWRTFNEDDLEDVKEPQDLELQELEADLDPDDKDATFQSVISNIKQLIARDDVHNKNLSIVLENMDQIINILELPSLTGACIKAGYYSEALEISSYTRRLAIRFPKSDLIREVENGIKLEMSHMLTGLIRLLRTNLKQSSIIKILSYLRRIPPFSQVDDSDAQLKRILLHSRYQFIKLELDSLTPLKDSGFHEKYLKRIIEVIREHGFGSIMTFKNVFPGVDDTELGPVDIVVEAQSGEEKQKEELKDMTEDGTDGLVEDESEEGETNEEQGEIRETVTEDGSDGNIQETPEESTETITSFIRPAEQKEHSNLLLFEFVIHFLQELIKALELSLTKIDEKSTRDGLYLQLIYCAQSLGRIDPNFSDAMAAMLLNARDDSQFLVDRKAWVHAVAKQKQLAQSLSK